MKKETKKLIMAAIFAAASTVSWGNVQAEAVSTSHSTNATVTEGTLDYEKLAVITTSKDAIAADGKTITVNSKNIKIEASSTDAGTYSNQIRGVFANGGKETDNKTSKVILGNKDTEEINISVTATNWRPTGLLADGYGAEIDVTAKTLNIDVSGGQYGSAIRIKSNTQTESAGATRAKVVINADTINLTSNSDGGPTVCVFSNGQLDMNGDVTIINKQENGEALEVRGYSITNINTDGKHKTVMVGDINFGTPNTSSDAQGSGNKIDAALNINFAGEGSSWTGRSYQELGKSTSVKLDNGSSYYGKANGLNLTFSKGAQWNVTGDSFANQVAVEDGAVVNVTENANTVNLGTVELDNGTLSLEGTEQKVSVNNISGDGTVATSSLDNSVTIGEKDETATLNVVGSGALGDKILAGDASLDDLANVLSNNDGTSVADTVETQEGEIAGKLSAQVGQDGKVDSSTVVKAVNTSNQAISNMGTLSLMTWRQENNDMNKRLGELRASEGKQGVWVRMARGQAKYGAQSIKNQYNYYQLGYDSKISGDWILGGAVTYTDGESSFTNGTGTNKHTGFAIYGSNLKSDGSFIDIIAKYAHMENDFDVNGGVGTGEYSTNGYSFSAEYGKRFQQDGFWIEPQAELTYGKVSSADFTTKNGASVHQDSMDSLVGRLGFSLGKDIKRGNVYVRASYLYDFKGDVNVSMSKDGADSAFKTDLGGGWWEFGVGTNLSLGHDTHFYLDVETTAGGDVDTPWQWNAGVRFSF